MANGESMPGSQSSPPARSPGRERGFPGLRSLLLALVALGALGLSVELILLEHWSALPQLTPLVTLTLVLATTGAVALRPGRTTVRAFRGVMLWAVVAGLTGIALHFRDNVAFEREVTPEASLGSLTWHALRGATPLLAPGSLAQLGLLGLVFTYRHPALRLPHDSALATEDSPPARDPRTESDAPLDKEIT